MTDFWRGYQPPAPAHSLLRQPRSGHGTNTFPAASVSPQFHSLSGRPYAPFLQAENRNCLETDDSLASPPAATFPLPIPASCSKRAFAPLSTLPPTQFQSACYHPILLSRARSSARICASVRCGACTGACQNSLPSKPVVSIVGKHLHNNFFGIGRRHLLSS